MPCPEKPNDRGNDKPVRPIAHPKTHRFHAPPHSGALRHRRLPTLSSIDLAQRPVRLAPCTKKDARCAPHGAQQRSAAFFRLHQNSIFPMYINMLELYIHLGMEVARP
ncbi:MAG: hypothetical protein ACJAQ8_000933 [Haliea salexigens]|jgi:hypothetical protein